MRNREDSISLSIAAGAVEWRVDFAMAGYQGLHHWQGYALTATEAVAQARQELVQALNAYLRGTGMVDVQVAGMVDVQVLSVLQVGV